MEMIVDKSYRFKHRSSSLSLTSERFIIDLYEDSASNHSENIEDEYLEGRAEDILLNSYMQRMMMISTPN